MRTVRFIRPSGIDRDLICEGHDWKISAVTVEPDGTRTFDKRWCQNCNAEVIREET